MLGADSPHGGFRVGPAIPQLSAEPFFGGVVVLSVALGVHGFQMCLASLAGSFPSQPR